MNAVAVVGLDCVFPAAHGIEAYWELLMRGGDAIGPLPAGRGGEGFDDTVRGGFVADADVFDNDFFTIAPREAAAMDPQQRLLLQCAWRALEDSGRSPRALAGSDTGVFVGVMGSEWAQLHMGDLARITPQLGAGSSTGMTANRISYHLDLKGPSLAVDTACSSSLVAVHLAVNALLSGECSTALAAGVNLVLTPALGMVYQQMGLKAPDGRCKPFSADADGIGRSDGAGVVVLRRLQDALADGQRVYAVIRGTAVNQDGRSNGVTAPSRWSQQAVVAAAHRRAGVGADQVRFLEAHGTGTALGDIIECAALGEVYAGPRDTPCALGSVKGNIGHTEGAAGIAGLIKTALALHHRIVPASPFAARENPRLRLAERGLALLKAPLRLPPGEVLAGVSSFGMGGTNAHAVLASAPRPPHAATRAAHAAGVFTLSADTPEALRRNLAAQAEALARRPRGDAAPVCWTSNQTKTGLPYRAAFTARDTAQLADALRTAADDEQTRARVSDRALRPAAVAFLYPGQGCQQPGMTAALYRESAAYRRHLDDADDALRPHTGASVRDLILTEDPAVNRARWATPALFAVAHALTQTLADLGVVPDAVLGHGTGEYAAAVAAGVLSLPDAARLTAAHAAAAEQLPGGALLAVRGGEEEIADVLAAHPGLLLAAVDGPHDTVVSGTADVLEHAAKQLAARGLHTRRLPGPHPCPAPAAPAAAAGPVTAGPARIAWASARLGRMLGEEIVDAAYWAQPAKAPVRFADALSALVAETAPTCLVELGPTGHLLRLAQRAGLPAGIRLLHPAPGPAATATDLAEAVAGLYLSGVEPRWEALYEPAHRRTERLAPYVFSRARRFPQTAPAHTPGHTPAQAPGHTPAQASGQIPAQAPGPAAGPAVPDAAGPSDAPAARPHPSHGPGETAAGRHDAALCAVIDAVVEVGAYPREQVDAAARIYEDLGFDSVMIMQLKDRIEQRLPQAAGITMQQLLPALRSVGTLAVLVRELTGTGVTV
ncbi:acyltransferase domain-containing protein [Streptomyces sp. NBC_01136]|uniref:type I polyketide synthase n=1 Tax=Streptomyces sp. NBC_01136 TaxID=2903754 RepID=UPI0038677178|nr:acyltransferase domain-containing protein [Streptomyces sp. NBC_01136]WST81114.1 acyltransferase domain-containing protein [Streptomyces sp. NBC_01136]